MRPEQRFGNHADVDVRADIYALGCILYELFAGAPPVRRDSPPVASANESFAALDPVINRMTSYDPGARFQHVEAAIVDIALAFGWVTATMRGAREPEPTDVNEMTRLLRSNNGAKRAAGIQLALGLGEAALPALHDLMGHSRREVRNAAASALGQIGDQRSIPYLVAGLHSTSQRASTFRPTVDTAAESLAAYPVERRIEIFRGLSEHIRPQQVIEILKGFDSTTAFDIMNELHERELIFFDWGESTGDIMIEIDEIRAWPLVWPEISQRRGWRLPRLMSRVQTEHQLELIRNWLNHPDSDAWSWDQMIEAILKVSAPPSDLIPMLQELSNRLAQYPGRGQNRTQQLERVNRRIRELKGE